MRGGGRCTQARNDVLLFYNHYLFLKAIEQMKKEHNQIIEQRKSEGKEVEEREPRSSHQLLEYMHLDLSSLSSTAEFVAEFKQTGYQLHVLICNAGIAFANQGRFAHQVSNSIIIKYSYKRF